MEEFKLQRALNWQVLVKIVASVILRFAFRCVFFKPTTALNIIDSRNFELHADNFWLRVQRKKNRPRLQPEARHVCCVNKVKGIHLSPHQAINLLTWAVGKHNTTAAIFTEDGGENGALSTRSPRRGPPARWARVPRDIWPGLAGRGLAAVGFDALIWHFYDDAWDMKPFKILKLAGEASYFDEVKGLWCWWLMASFNILKISFFNDFVLFVCLLGRMGVLVCLILFVDVCFVFVWNCLFVCFGYWGVCLFACFGCLYVSLKCNQRMGVGITASI